MATLVDSKGRPISSGQFKKKAPPATGPSYGQWSGPPKNYFETLPGGGLVQFDLSRLTLSDFSAMRDHYQVNSSLAVLSFMQHQSNWHIECEDKKIADHCEENLRDIWTELNRAMSTANWAGFSPNVLEWENDVNNRTLQLHKIKDLHPMEAAVNWKEVEGWAPPNHVKPKFKVYDGIKQIGSPWPIPVENTFWYSMLKENGDFYGRKLLRPAFQSWFFSILIHLFANRYHERFGEPTPIGRAPLEDEVIDVNGNVKNSRIYMAEMMSELRSRGVVVLPNDATDLGGGKLSYDYSLEYLESQMRGADFDRYLTRLDEEVSIGLFTPILLLRTADVGSYNLGQGHMQLYLWMLNAMDSDRASYINPYILSPMVDFNFSPKAPRARIVYHKKGDKDSELVRSVMQTLLQKDKVKVDLVELGEMTGMTLTEIKETVKKPEVEEPVPGEEDETDPEEDPPTE